MTVINNRGVSAIESAFERGKILIPYLVAGFPDEKSSLECMKAAFNAGADMLEIGVPFSDPIADGAVIQHAQDRALRNGMTLRKTLRLAADLAADQKKTVSKPLILMCYYNPILHFGIERFVDSALESGVDGVIVPDLVPDEAELLIESARKKNFATVFLAAPNSSEKRLRLISKSSSGFIYALGLEGVTGERDKMSDKLSTFVENIRSIDKSENKKAHRVGIGFGVSKPEHFKMLSAIADGVIVGSAVVRRAESSPQAVREFIEELRR
ncbi:MAG: tryptophan synthase subunit alpha [Candidatus Hydrogenedentes bacterium CG07_land_8_20_14_0_80_42_17]|nr:MAG: tryptophan synthase subunit alpha [Candidatus Hydrogenedentes bacterium CG07_land_8_20_14_0_80_42_17]